jgi:hypothetical protein
MKISKEKYLKAAQSLPKLRQAEEIVKLWEQAKKERPEAFADGDVTSIERVDGVFMVTSRPIDAQKRLVS